MSTRKKAQRVGVIRHRGGTVVELFFNPNDDPRSEHRLTFFADIGESHFRARSAKEVEESVRKFLDENLNIEWVPVIEVKETAPIGARGNFIGLEVRRFYISEGKVRKELRWDCMTKRLGLSQAPQTEAGRLEDSKHFYGGQVWLDEKTVKEQLPKVGGGFDTKTTWLAYDEATFVALERICSAISELRERLRGLLETGAGRQTLADFGAKLLNLLPAPQA